MDDSELESPVLSVAGSLFGIGFGAVFMAVGLAIAAGLTQDVGPRWQKYLEADGYGTQEQVRASAEARAAFVSALASWKEREAARVELAKTTLAPEVVADEDQLTAALEELREKADDWEPNDPGDALQPLPEKPWGRFTALTTTQRLELFKGLLVGPVFFFPGFFIAGALVLSLFRERGARRLAREFPARPWLHDSEWSQLRGSPRGASSLAGIAMMLGVFGWLALCTTLFWILEREPEGNFTFLMIVADLAATFIAVLTVRRFLQRLTFGQPQLLLGQVPLEPGKPFSARLLMARSVGAAEKLKATLRLEESTTSGTGKNQHTHQVIVWKQELEVPRAAFLAQDGRLSVELHFEVPDDQPCTHFGREPTYEWQLSVAAETAGVDFEELFSVPVFRVKSDGERKLRSAAA